MLDSKMSDSVYHQETVDANEISTEVKKITIPPDIELESQNKFLFYGLLTYIFIFYTQIAARIPALSPLRIEFLVGSILLLAIGFKFFSGELNFMENKINLAGLLFFTAAFLTIPFAMVKSLALETFINMFKFSAVYFMIIASITTERRLKIYFYLYLSLVGLIFVEPFINSLFGKGFIWNNGMWRLAGTTSAFGHPNQLGGVASANLPFFFYMMFYVKSKIGKVIYFSLIIMAIRVVMLTQSRTGFLGVLMFGFFVWLFSKSKVLSLILGIFLLIILWQFAPEQTKDRFRTFASIEKVMTTDRSEVSDAERSRLASTFSRWRLIQRAWTCFLEHPIIGVGLRNFNSYNGRKYGLWHPPHNSYLQALAEMGLIGFLAFMYFIIVIFKNLRESKEIQLNFLEDQRFLYYLTKAVTVYFLVRLVVSTFGQDLYANYWWVAAGFAVVIYRVTLQKYQYVAQLAE